MINYAPQAAITLAYLKQSYNDIDIYVEDKGMPNTWLLVVRRILPEDVKLTSVNVLGGRGQVVRACKVDREISNRKKLYIIDADFDFLLGIRKPPLRHLYRIRGYCIENLLVHEKNVVKLALALQPKQTENQISQSFDYGGWISAVSRPLSPLFAVYAVAHKLVPDLQTGGYTVRNLYVQEPQETNVCPQKARARALQLARSIIKVVGYQEFFKTHSEVKKRLRNCNVEQVISGKDYLFPLFAMRVRKKLKFRGTDDQLKALLGNCWTPSVEPWLARRIASLFARECRAEPQLPRQLRRVR